MRAARLHGVGDLRIETLEVPRPGPRELVVRVEACGICPTDVRKHTIGSRDGYPLNPGHEWVGDVVEVGPALTDWSIGARVCGDTYAGYAEYAVLSVEPTAWSNGAHVIPAGSRRDPRDVHRAARRLRPRRPRPGAAGAGRTRVRRRAPARWACR